ncbi:NAD-binding protein, partial [bacterium LRH843]|nr:NAD-binding protein [bacterium LRH843]
YVQGAKRAAVIGSGFIGMELATVLRNQDLPVTIVARDEVPFEKILGERIGRRLRREQEEAGVTYAGGAEIEEFEGEEQVR